ncbi:TetR-like C-terminal domain-containing protein [Streptosporangium sandarakinum]|uniref:TetR-like C-terminal domain-containing protein n=1 Tax=Streptosporangium sandarakinum TaxID=1260955 RepID=UPI0033AC0CED
MRGINHRHPHLPTPSRGLNPPGRRPPPSRRPPHAQDVGEIRADVDVRVLVDQLWGAVYHRLLIPDEPVTTAFVDALVDNLFDGIAPR